VHGGVRPWWQQGSSEPSGVAAGGQRLALGVRFAVCGVEALPQQLAVARHDRPDHRVRRRSPATFLRELDGAREVEVIGLQELGHDADRRIGE
jgi:hypothetical protein